MKRLSSDKRFLYTEKLIVVALIAFAVIGTAGAVVLKQLNLAMLGLYLVIPMMAAAIVWFLIRSKNIPSVISRAGLSEVLLFIFLLCFLISVIILHIAAIRTISYYLLIAFMGAMILIQILYTPEPGKKQINLILMQIILLFLNIIWGVTLKYYFFIGRGDFLFHSWIVENLINAGHINSTFEFYQAFPLWHILCTAVYQMTSLPIEPAKIMFITNGFIYGCLVLLIYLTASRLFNTRIALLSALFLCFNTDAMFYGMYSISRSVVFFLEGLLFMLLLQQKTNILKILCFFVIVGLVMYHTASMPFIIFILTLFIILQAVYSVSPTERLLRLNFLLLTFVSTVTYWMYAGTEVFNSIVRSLFSVAPTGIMTESIVEAPLNELVNYLQYSPLLFFIILGVLWGVKNTKIRNSAKIFLVISLLLVPVSFPGPALLLNKLAGNFNLSRFNEYSFIFFCIAGAAGLYVLFASLNKKLRIAVVVVFSLMAFLSISNDFTASDNPLVKRPFYTFYLTKEECTSLERAVQMTNGYVMTDYISCRYLQHSEFADKVHVLEVGGQQEFLVKSRNDIILIRNNELSHRPLILFTAPDGQFIFDPTISDSAMDYYFNNQPLWNTVESYNIIYDSGSVKGYQ